MGLDLYIQILMIFIIHITFTNQSNYCHCGWSDYWNSLRDIYR